MNDTEILLVATIVIMSIGVALLFYKFRKHYTPMALMLKINEDQSKHISMLNRAIDAARIEIPYTVNVPIVIDGVDYRNKMWDERVRDILENSFRFDEYNKEQK